MTKLSILEEEISVEYLDSLSLSEYDALFAEIDDKCTLEATERFTSYNRHDVQLIIALNNKLKLLELAVEMAYSSGINYSDVFSPMRVWDAKIYNKLMKKNITIPIPDSKQNKEYPGGYVKAPQLGLHKWVMSFDLASLYPSIIRGWNLGMETLVRKDVPFDFHDVIANDLEPQSAEYCYAANGFLYSNEKQSLYSELMEELYADRKRAKGLMMQKKQEYEDKKDSADDDELKEIKRLQASYDTEQMGKKILLNSFYGILALKHFRFFDVNIAESITLNGQMAIQYIAERTSAFMNKVLKTDGIDYVIAIDTDSQYLNVEGFVKVYMAKHPEATTEDVVSYLDSVGEKLNKFIDGEYLKLKDALNLREHQLLMDREGIFGHEIGTNGSAGFWTAKKRYVLNCYDMEGVRYSEPKLKIMGLETQRSSTPKVFKTELKAMFKEIVSSDNDSLIEKVDTFRRRIDGIGLNDIAFPTGVNNIAKYSLNEYPIKGTPGHVRAAITHNRLVAADPEMNNKYPIIRAGEKALLINLKEPNPTGEKMFAYIDQFPVETGLLEYIDRKAVMDKGFIKPLEAVTESIGWKLEKAQTLDSFFG